MRKFLIVSVVLASAAAVSAAGWRAAGAQQGAPATGGGKPPGASTIVPLKVKRPPGLRGEIQQQLDDAEQKLVQLASVVPPEKFGWRPAPGVRSFGEVCLHVAGGNYEIGAMWGMKVPAGVDPRNLEKEGADKAKTVAALKQSFDFVHQAIDALPDSELHKPIKIFGRDAVVAEAMLGIASHDHEHLGQAIAYARMNGVVPPWSAVENQRGR